MASQAPSNQLPLFYSSLEPLSSVHHQSHKMRAVESAPHLARAHAIPITLDEFIACQRFYPIVFSTGENPVPLVLMGLNEGVNVFLDDAGKLVQEAYVPAYVRRYPFMLARLRPDSEDLSLCFDPNSGIVGAFEEGQVLFEEGKPSEATNNILKFCEEFELSAQRTNNFMQELKELELLIDGEVSIQPPGAEQPFIYRGFQMVDEAKFRELRGDTLRKINQSGMLAVLFAHLFSLPLIREISAKQVAQGKGPYGPGTAPAEAPVAANA